MVDPTPVVREGIVRDALSNEPMTMPRLLVRGASHRVVLHMLTEGEVQIIGSTDNARPIWALVP